MDSNAPAGRPQGNDELQPPDLGATHRRRRHWLDYAILLALLTLGGAAVTIPLVECECIHLRRAYMPSEGIDCPCCGTRMRISLIHRELTGHVRHFDDLLRRYPGDWLSRARVR